MENHVLMWPNYCLIVPVTLLNFQSIEKRRNSSLTGGGGGEQDQLEVTRQFLATNTKVINRNIGFCLVAALGPIAWLI